jgi:hypothetical protein
MAGKKEYRVTQIQGKITWQVEELWEGGQVRGPYGTKEAAIHGEEHIAEENGFADDLVLGGAVGEEVKPEQAFEKDDEGTWVCVRACSINIQNKEVVFSKGLTFQKDQPFMGVDVADWLDKNVTSES